MIIVVILVVAAVVTIAYRRRATRAAAVDPFAVADVVDLFSLACGAGLTVAAALDLVADHATGVLGVALVEARRRAARGALVADVLSDLPCAVGESVRPLTSALAMGARYGTPVVPALERASYELRAAQRRALERRARRLPVALVFPLVLCCLPAFVLLTVAPLLIAALSGLHAR